MIVIYIILSIVICLIVFLLAPAVVCYRSIFCRRKVLTLEDKKLKKPAIEPFREKMLDDWNYLRSKGFERISVTAHDGITLCADYYDRHADKTAVMVHGFNADPYVNLASPARWLYDEGFNLLVIYQRAHSFSGGNTSGMGLLEKDDVAVWLDYIVKRDSSQRVLLYGTSMGGATLAYLSDQLKGDRVRCMIIDCGFISAERQFRSDAVRMHLPPVLIPFLVAFSRRQLGIDIRDLTTNHLCSATVPILFLHGTADITVPLEEGKKNYEACSSEKQMVIVEGAEHTTAFQTNEQQVTAAYREFLSRYF